MDDEKLTKLGIEELRKTLPVLSREEQRGCTGGAGEDYDCWWHCIAYVKSGGNSYSNADARALTQAYYGDNFDPNYYAFSGYVHDYDSYVANYVTCPDCGAYTPSRIMTFKGDTISGWEGKSGLWHSVIITGEDPNSVYVFDPSRGVNDIIPKSDLDSKNNFVTHVK